MAQAHKVAGGWGAGSIEPQVVAERWAGLPSTPRGGLLLTSAAHPKTDGLVFSLVGVEGPKRDHPRRPNDT